MVGSQRYTPLTCWPVGSPREFFPLLTGLVFHPAGWHATFLTNTKLVGVPVYRPVARNFRGWWGGGGGGSANRHRSGPHVPSISGRRGRGVDIKTKNDLPHRMFYQSWTPKLEICDEIYWIYFCLIGLDLPILIVDEKHHSACITQIAVHRLNILRTGSINKGWYGICFSSAGCSV